MRNVFNQFFDKTTRQQAFLIHLGISLAIFSIFTTIVFFFWFPGPLFTLEGGWNGLRIVAILYLVLGPFLTLLLFKPGKKGLKLDLTLVALLQTAALLGGAWTIYQARPAVIIFADDMLYTLTLSRLQDENIPPETYKQFVKQSPSWVYIKLPDDPLEKADIIIKSARTSKKLFLLFGSYTPLSRYSDEALSGEMHISNYIKRLPQKFQNQFQAYMKDLNKPQKDLAFFPLQTTYRKGVIIIERETWKIAGYLAIPYDRALDLASRQTKPI